MRTQPDFTNQEFAIWQARVSALIGFDREQQVAFRAMADNAPSSEPINHAQYRRRLQTIILQAIADLEVGLSETAPEEGSTRGGKAGSFTVFVCSTFSDLSQEREGVLDAIRRLKLQHDSMEFFRSALTAAYRDLSPRGEGKRRTSRDCRPPIRHHCSRARNLLLRSRIRRGFPTKEAVPRLHAERQRPGPSQAHGARPGEAEAA